MKDNANINPKTFKKLTVLVAPLDWGLGHATRCIPIIRHLLDTDYEVIIAAEGPQLQLLRKEFPSVETLIIPGYRLKYSKTGWRTFLKIILQIPKILTAIKSENRWLNQLLKQRNIHAIISDNRYGLYHPEIRSFFITHQLAIRTPFGKMAALLLQRKNYRLINKFTECWVPDYETSPNLAGALSHPYKMPSIPVRYIGPLSRFSKNSEPTSNDLLIMLSGPEPQRTILENICLKELKSYQGRVVMLRGLPDAASDIANFNNVTIYNHLPSGALEELINRSGIIISRSGYSTVMDTLGLGKACIFVPTPGQTEQAYLASYLSEKKYCLYFEQKHFSLEKALQQWQAQKLAYFENSKASELKGILLLSLTAKDLQR